MLRAYNDNKTTKIHFQGLFNPNEIFLLYSDRVIFCYYCLFVVHRLLPVVMVMVPFAFLVNVNEYDILNHVSECTCWCVCVCVCVCMRVRVRVINNYCNNYNNYCNNYNNYDCL